MFNKSYLFYFLFVVLTLLNEVECVNNCRCPEDLTDDPNLGALPPCPREKGSKVPPYWKWIPVLVDNLSSNNSFIRDSNQKLFQYNTFYSLLFDEEKRARIEHGEKEREHIRNKQRKYNEMMKKQWKNDRMNSLPRRCSISR